MSWDGEPVIQSSRLATHKAALARLIDERKVYKCYCTPEEREAMRQQALAAGKTLIYDGRCDGLPDRPGAPFAWRFRMPKQGETVVDDMVQGRVVTPNAEIEDLVIARADGSPLYNFVVVVDDAAMGITHVVRGKDHLTNTPKQIHIYRGLGLPEPRFAHLPLILGLSKRLRSAGIEAYREQGYLPQAVNNYIARLGWSCGDQELFSTEELVAKFDLADVNRSEGALNLEKMEWINEQHIQRTDPAALAALAPRYLAARGVEVAADDPKLVGACRTVIKRAKTLVELADKVRFYFAKDDGLAYDEGAKAKFLDEKGRERLAAMAAALGEAAEWTEAALEAAVKAFCDGAGLKLKDVAQPTRVALTGEATGPGLYETMVVLGRASTLARLARAARA